MSTTTTLSGTKLPCQRPTVGEFTHAETIAKGTVSPDDIAEAYIPGGRDPGIGHNGGPPLDDRAASSTEQNGKKKRGPRYAIIPADFVDDPRPKKLSHFRVLLHLGGWTDKNGWFIRSGGQERHAADLRISRQCFNEALGDLVKWRFVEKVGVAGGKLRYRVIMDSAERDKDRDLSSVDDSDEIDLSTGDDSNETDLSSGDDRSASTDDRQPVASGATAPVVSAATPYCDLPSTTSKISPPPPQTRKRRVRGESRGGDFRSPSEEWLDQLRADQTNGHVVEHLIAPLTALTVKHENPITLLRTIRDHPVIVEKPASFLGKLAEALTTTRKKLISAKDVTEAIPAVLLVADKLTITPEWPSWRDSRDAVMLLLGWAAALRGAELIGLDWLRAGGRAYCGTGFLTSEDKGLQVTLLTSKAAQITPATLAIPDAEMPSLRLWLEKWLGHAKVLGGEPLFRPIDRLQRIQPARLSGDAVAKVVRRRMLAHAQAEGFSDTDALMLAKQYSSHSMRRGYCTTASNARIPLGQIRARSRHTSDATLGKYIQSAEGWNSSGLGGIGF